MKALIYKLLNKVYRYRNPLPYWENRAENYYLEPYVTETFPDDEIRCRFLLNQNPQSILEVGCATGRSLYLLASFLSKSNLLLRLEGCDFSSNMVNQAYKLFKSKPNVSFKVADARSLPYSNDSFDWVYTRGCLMHLQSESCVEKAILEMCRVAKFGVFLTEEIAPASKNVPSGYSPNGICHWWNFDQILKKLGVTFSFIQNVQNREFLGLWEIKKNSI